MSNANWQKMFRPLLRIRVKFEENSILVDYKEPVEWNCF